MPNAHAYLDPGTGSLLLSSCVAIIASAVFFIKGRFYKILDLFKSNNTNGASNNTNNSLWNVDSKTASNSHNSANYKNPLHKFKRNKNRHGQNHHGIVFYNEGKQYFSVFHPIVEYFESINYPYTYYTSAPNDPLLSRKTSNIIEFIGDTNKSYLRLNNLSADIVLMTTPQLDVLQIKRSKGVTHYCHIIHSLPHVDNYEIFALDYFDSVFTNSPIHTDFIRQVEAKRALKTKLIEITGCTYLDALESKLHSLLGGIKGAGFEDSKNHSGGVLWQTTWVGCWILAESGGVSGRGRENENTESNCSGGVKGCGLENKNKTKESSFLESNKTGKTTESKNEDSKNLDSKNTTFSSPAPLTPPTIVESGLRGLGCDSIKENENTESKTQEINNLESLESSQTSENTESKNVNSKNIDSREFKNANFQFKDSKNLDSQNANNLRPKTPRPTQVVDSLSPAHHPILESSPKPLDPTRKVETPQPTQVVSGSTRLTSPESILESNPVSKTPPTKLSTPHLDFGFKNPNRKTILISPSWGREALLSKYGMKIIAPLLDSSFNVIIRPHPQSHIAESAMLEGIKKHTAGRENIAWDSNVDNIFAMSAADIMLGDFSGILFDFLCLFSKPIAVMKFDFNITGYDLEDIYDTPWVASALKKIGTNIDPAELPRLPEILESAINNKELSQNVAQMRELLWHHRGRSAEVTAKALLRIHKEILDTRLDFILGDKREVYENLVAVSETLAGLDSKESGGVQGVNHSGGVSGCGLENKNKTKESSFLESLESSQTSENKESKNEDSKNLDSRKFKNADFQFKDSKNPDSQNANNLRPITPQPTRVVDSLSPTRHPILESSPKPLDPTRKVGTPQPTQVVKGGV